MSIGKFFSPFIIWFIHKEVFQTHHPSKPLGIFNGGKKYSSNWTKCLLSQVPRWTANRTAGTNTRAPLNPTHRRSQSPQDGLVLKDKRQNGLVFKDKRVQELRQSSNCSSTIYKLLTLTRFLDLSYKMEIQVSFSLVVVRIKQDYSIKALNLLGT